MFQAILIVIGGGMGSLCRYWLSLTSYILLGGNFPYGTLVVNVLGSCMMGFLSVIILERFNGQAEAMRAFLLIGFLGGFTTFSSFSIETFYLFENGEVMKSLFNIIASVSCCLIAVTLGAFIGRQV